MNKGPIAKCQNFMEQNEDVIFSRRNDVIPKKTVHPLPPWNRGTHLQKREKERKMMAASVRPINTTIMIPSFHSFFTPRCAIKH